MCEELSAGLPGRLRTEGDLAGLDQVVKPLVFIGTAALTPYTVL